MFKFWFKKDEPQTFDYIIAGLGNPGAEYENTRHNVGFMALSLLSQKYNAPIKKIKFKSVIGQCEIEGKRCLLLCPQTFMNNSGQAVVEAMSYYKIPPERTLIIFDDISLDVGRIRIRRKGSDGGHNGVKSIIYLSASDQFPRIKIGVGAKPHPDYDLARWVLSPFKKDELDSLGKALNSTVAAVECIMKHGIDYAMNKYNIKP
ncbi:MAG TPA: aminoacyl-tRNA hydrolase [Clostridiales bacterium]|nr:aminoacyl-tRNA hydrolase [Clostridiales bacterium]